ncbi:tripartite tricarboxylate transporter substrate binding protein [Bradyrhizobium sp. LHD-71]|uniref:Bug family tripartite tricarboxylate transporter substrate binding protein n=1 Tax=Bradyrhizobium sp. LHD-71 TaxID=3072141 RepID=UPI00280CD171|nr:tripartite tricarboxylate transporter substrate binding protein [Bradyrhizobium sp. LHD-71]MDQ8730444.1 tripartite tricarboxylate transporter substrate binding protein [Bradyrhizobium sp. LHD-71]
MTIATRIVRVLLAVGAVTVAATAAVRAQTYPDRAIQLVVPFPPGGPADIVARPLAEGLSRALGQPVVVLNKSGASGTIGAAFVAKAQPDGYTLLMGTSNELTMSPGLFDQLPYDPSRDFVPVSTTVLFPNVLVVGKDLPIHAANDLVAATRAHPERFNYGTSGSGSTNHLTAELYRTATGLQLNYVSYRGGAAAMTDLMGGRIQAMFATMPSAAALINSGAIRALMVTDTKRWSAIPDVPDAAEAGFPQVKVISFNGVLAPAGTPRPIIDKLNAAVLKVMNTPDMKAQMAISAGEVSTSTPEAFAQILKSDFESWLAFIKANGIHAN